MAIYYKCPHSLQHCIVKQSHVALMQSAHVSLEFVSLLLITFLLIQKCRKCLLFLHIKLQTELEMLVKNALICVIHQCQIHL